jgi:serine phosphatase RsbU (regulator of sigma subunit)
MGYKHFHIQSVIRILLLTLSIGIFFFLLSRRTVWVYPLVTSLLIAYQIRDLIHYVEKTNRDLSRFLNAIRYKDYSESFSSGSRGSSFEGLSQAFNNILRLIQSTRSEGEEHVQYLQTVVQHLRTGLIAFQQSGEVEWTNAAARRLLKVSQLHHIRSLESLSKALVQTLFEIKAGERALVKVHLDGRSLHLALDAARFRIRNRTTTLVSLQDIQNELERERMFRELEIAHQVQLKLLPKEKPRLSRGDLAGFCLPAKEVGGDYYDYIDLGDGKTGIVTGDVSGKGVPAAIYMTLTKGILQSQAPSTPSPGRVLSHLNRLMYQSIERGAFVTLFYAVWNPKTQTMSYARAGHNPALYWNSSENGLSRIEPPGIALGLERGGVFDHVIEEQSIHVRSGDLFIMYTDGLTEARNIHDQQYGEHRLMDLLKNHIKESPDSILESLSRDVADFTGGAEQFDDMTMVVFKME